MRDDEHSVVKEEQELEDLVLDEFERIEREIKNPVEEDQAGDEGSQKPEQLERELKGEEERFIANAVEWLRPNKDKYAILNKIFNAVAGIEEQSVKTAAEAETKQMLTSRLDSTESTKEEKAEKIE